MAGGGFLSNLAPFAAGVAESGSSIFRGLAEAQRVAREEEDRRLRREHQTFLERLESERLRLEQQREGRLKAQGERPSFLPIGGRSVVTIDPWRGPQGMTQYPEAPETTPQRAAREASEAATALSRGHLEHLGKPTPLAPAPISEADARMFQEWQQTHPGGRYIDFDTEQKRRARAGQPPTSPFGLFMRGQDPDAKPAERTAAQQQYAEFQKQQAAAAGERVVAQGQVLDRLPPSHTQSPYRGRVFVDPKTYGRVPPPKTVGDATAAWTAGRAIPVTQQQEQQITRLRVAFPIFDALEMILPHITGASQGAETWSQVVANLANRAAGSTALLGLFDVLSNDAMIELSTALAGTSRPAVMMMEALRSHSLPKLREALQAGQAKLGAGRSVIRSRIESILGKAELTPLQLPGLDVNPTDFKLE